MISYPGFSTLPIFYMSYLQVGGFSDLGLLCVLLHVNDLNPSHPTFAGYKQYPFPNKTAVSNGDSVPVGQTPIIRAPFGVTDRKSSEGMSSEQLVEDLPCPGILLMPRHGVSQQGSLLHCPSNPSLHATGISAAFSIFIVFFTNHTSPWEARPEFLPGKKKKKQWEGTG